MQGITLQQAEKIAGDYKHKGEALFNQAGEFFKDAVKVVPPEEATGSDGIVWDGSDVWSFPSPIGTPGWGGGSAEKEKDGSSSAGPTQSALGRATRAEALLKRLKHDPDMLKLDPSQDDSVKTQFEIFEKGIESQGGIGGDVWTAKVQNETAETDDDTVALEKVLNTLGKYYCQCISALGTDAWYHT